jgi:amidophosphoribosyltransferase
MNSAILEGQSAITELEESCFTGKYIAGNITDEYLNWVEQNQTS